MNNTKRPVVSVVMPAYNAAKYIGKSINSVLAQTYGDFELIVINDGSIDETLDIVEKYADKDSRIRVFSQVNQGVSVARNKALEEALGEYIAFLDSDDLWDDIFLEIMIKGIKQKNCDMLYCETDIINSDGTKEHINSPLAEGHLFTYVTHNNEIRLPFNICGIVVRSSILTQYDIKFDAGVAIMEDVGFYIKLLSVTKAYCVPGIMSHYCKHELSATTFNFMPDKWRGSVDIFKYAEPFILKYRSDEVDRFYRTWDYYAYRFVWSVVKARMYDDAIKYISLWEDNLCRFGNVANKLNDRFKCKLLMKKNKSIMKLLNIFRKRES